MSYVTVIWSVIAAGSLLLAVMYGGVWILDRRQRASLAFAFEALAIVLSVIVELGLMRSESASEWGEWVRWNQVPVLLRTAALVAFIHFYFGTGRPWLMAATVGTRVFIAIASFVMDPNFNFSRIDSIAHTRFLGEEVTVVGSAVTSPYQWFATFSVALVLVFVIDASLTLWRQGTPEARRKAVVIGGASLLSWGIGVTYTQFMVYQEIRLPVLLSPPYLVMLAAMTFELSRDTLRASRLARELRASQARLDLAASAAGLALWSWDPATNRTWTTRAARDMFGLAADEPFEIERVFPMIDADDAAAVTRVWRHAVVSGAEAETQFRARLPDGSSRWLLVHGRAERDAANRLLSVQGVLRDITGQHRAREENEELRRELAHAGRISVLGTLSSSLAHELGQPLGAILLNTEAAELLLKRPDPDLNEIRQILADIRRDDHRAAEVIERLRKLLKRRQMDFAPISVESLVNDVAALLKSDVIARHVTLDCSSEGELPSVQGDRVHLSQVLINLVINGMDAVAHLPPAQRHVSLRARVDGRGFVELAVGDSGPGIAPNLLAKVFEPFFTTKPNGMGMGLSVSRTIIDAHGGRMWAENGPLAGAVFIVTLPVSA